MLNCDVILCADLLKLIDELTAGTLVEPPGGELSPGADAAAWAWEQHRRREQQQQRSRRGSRPDAEEPGSGKQQPPLEVWASLGVWPQLGAAAEAPDRSQFLLPGSTPCGFAAVLQHLLKFDFWSGFVS